MLKWHWDRAKLVAPRVLTCAPSAAAFVNKVSDIGRDWIQALVMQCAHKPGLLQCCWLNFVTSAEAASLEDQLWHMWHDHKGDHLCRIRGDVRATKQCLVSVCLSQAQLGPRRFPLQGVYFTWEQRRRRPNMWGQKSVMFLVQPARTADVKKYFHLKKIRGRVFLRVCPVN